MSFMTTEYDVFRYSVIMASKRVSDNAVGIIETVLPNINNSVHNYMEIDNYNFNIYRQQIVEELNPLIKYIDFKLIQETILVNIIEPLNIIPISVLFDAYTYHTKSNNKLKFRGNIIGNNNELIWHEPLCGSKLAIEDNGRVIRAMNIGNKQNARTKIGFSEHGIYEWDIIIEVYCVNSWVGICESDNFDYDKWTGFQANAWVLGSNGSCYNNFIETIDYCPSFGKGKGDIITVHLDMSERTCAFSVNGKRYPPVSTWKNLPAKLYPVISISYPGRFRIQPHSPH